MTPKELEEITFAAIVSGNKPPENLIIKILDKCAIQARKGFFNFSFSKQGSAALINTYFLCATELRNRGFIVNFSKTDSNFTLTISWLSTD